MENDVNLKKLAIQATGADSVARGIDRSTQLDWSMLRIIKEMIRDVRSSEKNERITSEVTDPSARFDAGMNQYGVSNSELTDKLNASYKMFFIYFIGLVAVMTLSFCLSRSLSGIHLFSLALPTIAMGWLLTISTFRWGFYNWQIRNMKIEPFIKYLIKPGEWLPSQKFNTKRKNGKNAGKVVMAMMFFGLAFANVGTPAFAADATASTTAQSGSSTSSTITQVFTLPGKNDIFRNIMENIFPNVGPLTTPNIFDTSSGGTTATGTNGQSAFAGAFEVFLAVLMATAMSLLSFHMTQTLVSIGQEGKVFGHAWSLVWAPVRVFCGIGMLAPAIKGFCLAQIVVLYVAMWGGSFGNLIMTTYINNLVNPQITPKYIPGMTELAQGVAERSACYAFASAFNKTRTDVGGQSEWLPDPTQPQNRVVFDGSTTSRSAKKDNKMQDPAAGIASLTNTAGGSTSEARYYAWNFGPCGIVEGIFYPKSTVAGISTMENKRINAFSAYVQSILPPMEDYASKVIVNDGSDMEASLGQVKSTVNSAYGTLSQAWVDSANSLINNLNADTMSDFRKTFEQYGWAEAGSYYVSFARMQAVTDSILSKTPDVTTAMANADGIHVSNSSKGEKSISNSSMASSVVTNNKQTNLSNVTNFNDNIPELNQYIGIAQFLTKDGTIGHISNLATVAYNALAQYSALQFASSGSKSDGAQTVANVANTAQNGTRVSVIDGLTSQDSGDQGGNVAGHIVHWVVNQISNMLAGMINGIGSFLGASSPYGNSYESGTVLNGQSSAGGALQQLIDFGHNCLDVVGYAATAIFAALVVSKSGLLGPVAGAGKWIMGKLGTKAASVAASGAAKTNILASLAYGFAQVVAGSLGFVLEAIMALLVALEVIGVFHAYVLPMIPYIHFLFFFMGVVIFVVEAMIAAPLWAFVHIRLDGQQFLEQNKTGYVLLFNLFLRIPLGLFGLFTSIIVFNSIVMFLDLTFYPAMQSALGNYNTGPIAMLTFLVMISYLHYQLAIRSFSLISALPNKVSQWMGAHGATHDDDAQNHASNMLGFIAGNVTSRAGSMVGKGIGKLGGELVGGGGQAPKADTKETPAGGGATPGNPRSSMGQALSNIPNAPTSAHSNRPQHARHSNAPGVSVGGALGKIAGNGGAWHNNLASELNGMSEGGAGGGINGANLQNAFSNMKSALSNNPGSNIRGVVSDGLKSVMNNPPSDQMIDRVMRTIEDHTE